MIRDQYVREYWYDHEGCDKLIDFFHVADDMGETSAGRVGGATDATSIVQTDKKISTEVSFEDAWQGKFGDDVWGLHHYMDWITESYIDYWRHFELPGEIAVQVLPQIQYYKPNEGFFFPHVDAEAAVMERQLVYITYLNDVPDGGTIMVNNDMTITAKKGKTVIFPAGITHKHVGQISKKHHKYICTGWVEW